MTNSELAKELSQYPLTVIATGWVDFERFNKNFNQSDEESLSTNYPTYPTARVTTNPLKLSEDERRKLFGERVKMIRKLRGFSRSDIATKLEVSISLIGAYEGGKREPSLKNLIALSQILNVDTDWLLGLSPQLS